MPRKLSILLVFSVFVSVVFQSFGLLVVQIYKEELFCSHSSCCFISGMHLLHKCENCEDFQISRIKSLLIASQFQSCLLFTAHTPYIPRSSSSSFPFLETRQFLNRLTLTIAEMCCHALDPLAQWYPTGLFVVSVGTQFSTMSHSECNFFK